MSVRLHPRRRLLAATALGASAAMALTGPALAVNTLRIDISGAGTGVGSLAISQDATNNSNTVSNTGAANGGSLAIRGAWDSIDLTQGGAGNQLGGAITGATASTTASLSLTYGATTAVTGQNIHSLTIGGTTAPTDATVTVNVQNTAGGTTPNTITDELDGDALTYVLDVDGTDNAITNTVATTDGIDLSVTATGDGNTITNDVGAGGLVDLTVSAVGGDNTVANTFTGTAGAVTTLVTITGSENSVTNTLNGADSVSLTLDLDSDGNTITNTGSGSGAKVVGVTVPGSSSDNTISNTFGAVAGAQTSNLTLTGTSQVNYGLTSSAAGTVSNVTLNNVSGAASQGRLVVTQSGANASLNLTLNGTGFNMGTSLANSSGAIITQASNGAVLSMVSTASRANYTVSISQ